MDGDGYTGCAERDKVPRNHEDPERDEHEEEACLLVVEEPHTPAAVEEVIDFERKSAGDHDRDDEDLQEWVVVEGDPL